jgi:hypothetical protein
MANVPQVWAPLPQIFGGRQFRCRQCHVLTYASRNETSAQRAMHRADKIANRLHDMRKGATKIRCGEFPPKPSRMRWRTYFAREAPIQTSFRDDGWRERGLGLASRQSDQLRGRIASSKMLHFRHGMAMMVLMDPSGTT